MKFKKIDLFDKLFLISFLFIFCGFFLPCLKIPVIGNFNILNSIYGVILFCVYIITLIIFFFNKNMAEKLSLSINLSVLIFIIIQIFSNLDLFNLDLGFLGNVSLFTFLGIGIYLFLIGLIFNLIVLIFNFIKSKINMKQILVLLLATIFLVCILFFFFNIQKPNDFEIDDFEGYTSEDTYISDSENIDYLNYKVYNKQDLKNIKIKSRQYKFNFEDFENNYILTIPIEDSDLNILITTPYLKTIEFFSEKERNYEDYTIKDIENYLNKQKLNLYLTNNYWGTTYKNIGTPENIVLFYNNKKYNGIEYGYTLTMSNIISNDYNDFKDYFQKTIELKIIGDSGELSYKLDLSLYK